MCSSITFSFRFVNRKKSVRLNKGYVWLLVWNMSWFEVLYFCVYRDPVNTNSYILSYVFNSGILPFPSIWKFIWPNFKIIHSLKLEYYQKNVQGVTLKFIAGLNLQSCKTTTVKFIWIWVFKLCECWFERKYNGF